MNIFILDLDPARAATYMFDTHVNKMILETAQLLSTINGGPYKPTHENHPCTKWIGSHRWNYDWLYHHGVGLCEEFRYRFGKDHASEDIIQALREPLVDIPPGASSFALAMPDEYKDSDPVRAYRRYYHSKERLAKWTKREQPSWWMSETYVSYN
jgi:hypothetical protein